jgi:predicted 3-demethylubiquinone-9 3-methyltransferase (glyoxalase superfamily)
MQITQRIKPFLWFDGTAEEAAKFYVSIFPGSSIQSVSAVVTRFQLGGLDFIALNGGPQFSFTPAVSFFVDCETQDEVDELWAKLSSGGKTGRCGWLEDRYGLSWQIVPTALGEMLGDPDGERSDRVFQAMLEMDKLDIAGLRRAHDAVH